MQKKEQIEKGIDLLIVDFLNGEISSEGFKKLNKWLSEDTRNAEHFNLAKTAWIASGRRINLTEDRIEEALERVKQHLEIGKEKKVLQPFWNFYKIAASWIIFIVIGGLLNHFIGQKNEDNFIAGNQTVITSPIGSQSIVDLPDGSRVWLNAGSKLTYEKDFGNNNFRIVNLIGEAYFSVKSNKDVPFLVKTDEVTVKALGTKFNVKAYPDEEVITTTLEEGIIEVTSNLNRTLHNKVTLKPNEMYTYCRRQTKNEHEGTAGLKINQLKTAKLISNVNTEPLTSWKNKTWVIEAQPLGILAPILERRYNINISFSSEEISQFKFTSKIEDETIEQIMNALELTAPIKYKLEKNNLYLMIDEDRINRYRQNTNP